MAAREKLTADALVSESEVACVLGVTGRRVRQMVEDGVLEKVGRGKYNLTDCVKRYVAARESAKEPPDELDVKYKRARAKREAARADIAKMEADELDGKLHRSEDVAAMTADLLYTVRGAISALPGRLALNMVGLTSAAEASAIIRRETDDVLTGLSQYEYDPAKYEERVRARRKWEADAAPEEDSEA
ncbi:MAG: hypothetical protein LIO54_03600 [Oscillospiraceae bacterium]|nr:hypothetical protein [Oscillospiraceae bacterium]